MRGCAHGGNNKAVSKRKYKKNVNQNLNIVIIFFLLFALKIFKSRKKNSGMKLNQPTNTHSNAAEKNVITNENHVRVLSYDSLDFQRIQP